MRLRIELSGAKFPMKSTMRTLSSPRDAAINSEQDLWDACETIKKTSRFDERHDHVIVFAKKILDLYQKNQFRSAIAKVAAHLFSEYSGILSFDGMIGLYAGKRSTIQNALRFLLINHLMLQPSAGEKNFKKVLDVLNISEGWDDADEDSIFGVAVWMVKMHLESKKNKIVVNERNNGKRETRVENKAVSIRRIFIIPLKNSIENSINTKKDTLGLVRRKYKLFLLIAELLIKNLYTEPENLKQIKSDIIKNNIRYSMKIFNGNDDFSQYCVDIHAPIKNIRDTILNSVEDIYIFNLLPLTEGKNMKKIKDDVDAILLFEQSYRNDSLQALNKAYENFQKLRKNMRILHSAIFFIENIIASQMMWHVRNVEPVLQYAPFSPSTERETAAMPMYHMEMKRSKSSSDLQKYNEAKTKLAGNINARRLSLS